MSDVDAAIAAGRVAASERDFLLESRDGPAIVGIAIVTAVASIIVIGRALSRGFLVRRFGIDDALAVLSLICFVVFVGLCIRLIELGSGRHFDYITYVMPYNVIVDTQRLDFAAHIVYTVALLLCRVSGLAFYYRICSLHTKFLIAIRVVFGVLIAGFIPQLMLLILHCRPVTARWPYTFEPDFDSFTCLQWGLVYSVNSSVSLLCDVLLFGIPVIMLRVLEMPRKRKIQLACILLPGTGVIGISIARLVLVILGQWLTDMSWSYDPMLAVEVSEIGATLIALSIPGFKPIVDRFILRRSLNDESEPSRYNPYGSGAKRKSRSGSRSMALSTLRLRSQQHSVLTSHDAQIRYDAHVTGGVPRDDSSQEGIFVRMDFDVKEAQLEDGVKPASKL